MRCALARPPLPAKDDYLVYWDDGKRVEYIVDKLKFENRYFWREDKTLDEDANVEDLEALERAKSEYYHGEHKATFETSTTDFMG